MSATAVGAAGVGGGDRSRALQRLATGFERFRHRHLEADHDLHDNPLDGQRPEVMVIACSGSRTDPAICGAAPGDLSVVRNVAALVPPREADGRPHDTASAIELGATALGARRIVVLGRSFCAGVRCLLERDHGAEPFGFVSGWVEATREVREEVDGPVTEADRSLIDRLGEQAAVLAGPRGPFRQVDSWEPQRPAPGAGADMVEVPA